LIGDSSQGIGRAATESKQYAHPPPRASPRRQCHEICVSGGSNVLTTTLTGADPAELRLTWRTDQRARKRLEDRIFGKRILFTNREHWPVGDVVAAYRSQSEVEAGFRQQKDPHVVSFGPMRHWTDQKIRVHVFYSVLALTIAHLMRREARTILVQA
jgi:hypothetical protein